MEHLQNEKQEENYQEKKKNTSKLGHSSIKEESSFSLKLRYPEISGIFKNTNKSPQSIKDDCYVVLDTNVLLVPYTTSKESLEEIKKTYLHLVSTNSLIIFGQVAREFVKNRPSKLQELHSQIFRKKQDLPTFQNGKYPLLNNIPEYEELTGLEKQLDELLNQYKRSVNRVLEQIVNWNWNDPVSEIYSELFDDTVVKEFSIPEEELILEVQRRKENQIPPGYKDSSKGERDNEGDLVIWKHILEIGKNENKNIIFVSGDLKADWWYQSEKKNLYPRFELVDEFRRVTGGKTFHILGLSQLLNLYGADQKVVEEVRSEEVYQRDVLDNDNLWENWRENLLSWIQDRYSGNIVTGRELEEPDFIVETKSGRLGVDYWAGQTLEDISAYINQHLEILDIELEHWYVVFVVSSRELANILRDKISSIRIPQTVTVFVGYREHNGRIITL